MQESGLSIWQVLQSATINPAKILDKEMVSGNIAKGKVADMILLNADPTKSLENLTAINKIFKNGNVLDPESLVSKLLSYLYSNSLMHIMQEILKPSWNHILMMLRFILFQIL